MKIVCFYVGSKSELSGKIAKKFLLTNNVLAVTPMATANSFDKVINAVLGITDYLCWGVIIYSGIIWMFGNRTQSIERLIGGSSGYLIIRHAKDIQEFLKGL